MTRKKPIKKPTSSEKLARATRARDVYTVFTSGDLRAQWEQVKSDHDRSKARDAGMLAQSPETRRLAREVADLEQRMRDDAIDITVQALRRTRTPATPDDEATWTELVEAHPPRKDKDGKVRPEDSMMVNSETFPYALIRASIVGPDDLDDDEWDVLLLDVMSDGQFDKLFEKCWRLNRNDIDVPFSSSASRTLASAPSSKPRNASGSRGNGSSAGNPAT